MTLRKEFSYFLLIFFIGSFFRIKNINLEDYWLDEMFSFYISDPSLDLRSTYSRHNSIEQIPITFNILLKYFYSLFGYNTENGRYLVSFFGILNILIAYKIAETFRNFTKFYIFFTICIALNIFLIKYSLELRPYSLLSLTTGISILYFLKYLNNEKEMNFIILFFLATIGALVHPFGLILLFSYIIFFFLNKNLINKNLIFYILIFFIIVFIFYFFYFINLNEITSWIPKLEIKFFTDFFFQKFFGSRILGIFHLLIFFSLIAYFYKDIMKSKKAMFLVFFIISSYLLPLIFAFIFKNILIERYIIFVILPILLLISYSTSLIENKKIRLSIFSFLILITVGNFITEDSFKNLIFKKNLNKPNFEKSFEIIKKKNDKNNQLFILPSVQDNLGEKIFFYEKVDETLNNYIKNYIIHHKLNIEIIDNIKMNKNIKSDFWILCYRDISWSNCKIPLKNKEYKIIEQKNLNHLKIVKILLIDK